MKLTIDSEKMCRPNAHVVLASEIRWDGFACLVHAMICAGLAIFGVLFLKVYATPVVAAVFAVKYARDAVRCFRAVAPRWPS